jgi:hypothetical protein
MEVDDVYQYSELTGKDAIRLIHLQPCEDLEARIECSLKDAILTEYRDDIGDHYIAISYVWGDQNDTRSISVDGKRLEITASLDSALRHIRDDRRVLRVWADGVCINQNDVHDRNRQVRLMGDIYSIAQHTIVFLGLSSPQCNVVLNLISAEAQVSSEELESLSLYDSDYLKDGAFITIVEDEILARPWFTRVWILQELVLSRDPWLQCGKSRVRWHVFCRHLLTGQVSRLPWKSDSRTVLSNMNESRIKFRTSKASCSEKSEEFLGGSLLALLRARRGCALSDPRDMVYAHLGLASKETRDKVFIDYDKTIAQVYWDIACFYTSEAGLYSMLSHVENVQPEERQLPSWIPDWRSPRDPQFKPGTINKLGDLHWASSALPHILAVVGHQYGTIEMIIPRSSWPVLDQEWDRSTIDHVVQWISRSDHEFLRAREVSINFMARTDLSLNLPSYGEPFNYRSTEWAAVASFMLAWLPTWRSCFRPPHQLGFGEREASEHIFVEECIENLMSFTQCYNKSKQVVILHSGEVVLLPRLAQDGDQMIKILQLPEVQQQPYDIYAIFRACEAAITSMEAKEIVRSLERISGNQRSSNVQSCKFVTITSGILEGLSYVEARLMQRSTEMIFALH